MKHTKEPWIIAANDLMTVVDVKGVRIVRMHGNKYTQAKIANARRIVECVNALEGKNPLALQAFIDAAMPFISHEDLNDDESNLLEAYNNLIGIKTKG